jgi:hypothetical protein
LFSDLRQRSLSSALPILSILAPHWTLLQPNRTAFPTARAAQRHGERVAYLAAARAMGYWLNLASLSKRIEITGLNFE